MDARGEGSLSAGIGGPVSDDTRDVSIPDNSANGNAGAVDPDAARNAIAAGTDGDDFASAFSDPIGGTTAASAGTGSTGKRKYTRRNTKPQSEKSVPLSINGVEKILFSIHSMGEALLQIPELHIEESECKEIAKAIAAVNEQYMIALDPKKAAWIDLARVVGVTYGSRGVAYYMRKKAEAAQRPKEPPPPRPQDIPADGSVAVYSFDPKNQKPLQG